MCGLRARWRSCPSWRRPASLRLYSGCIGGKESFVAGSQIRLPWLRHGRDRIESGLPLHLGRTRFEAARAEPLTFDVLGTCLHARPPASKEPSCHWDALDTLAKRDCSPHQVHGAAVEAAAWRSSNLSCWSGHAAGLEQHIAADAGRKAAVRLGGLARVTVEVFWDEGVCGQHVDRTEAQTAAAMRQREDRGAVRAAMAKEQDPATLHLVMPARSRAPHHVSAAQDVLDFLVDLLSLGQPAVTQASPAARCVFGVCFAGVSAGQAVAAVIVCGPLLSQLHVLAAPVWFGYVGVGMSVSSATAV